MLLEKLKDEKEFSLSLNKEEKLLHFTWKPIVFSQERFKEIVTDFAEAAGKHGVEHLFIDARENKVTIAEDTQVWHDKVIAPKYVAAKIKKIAFLIPSSIFSELTHVKTFSKDNAAASLETRFFKSETDINIWFNS
jgi:hypothetical protein